VSINKSVDALEEPFKNAAKWLLHRCKEEGIHVIVFETRRSPSRQAILKAKGVSKTLISPHQFGMAIDCVLNTDMLPVRRREWPTGSGKLYPDAWDDGLNDAGRIQRPEVHAAWRKYGKLAEGLGLEWGGRWRDPDGTLRVEESVVRGQLFGWDLAHVQMRGWKNYMDG
jgi:hypothetical protein